jgi:antitoxin component YwqK of YwqJK toxin-antitoxin module
MNIIKKNVETDNTGKIITKEIIFQDDKGNTFIRYEDYYANGNKMSECLVINGNIVGVKIHYNETSGEPFGYEIFDNEGRKVGEVKL